MASKIDFGLLASRKRMNLCNLRPLSLWKFVTAAMEMNTLSLSFISVK